jgi:hypothetical protein
MWPTPESTDWDVEGSPVARRDHGWVLRVAHSVYQYNADIDLARSAAIAPREGELRRGADVCLSDYRVCHRRYVGEPSDL